MAYAYNHAKRYDDDQIKAMAICAMTALSSGDERGLMLVMTLSQHTRLDPNAVVARIKALSEIVVEEI